MREIKFRAWGTVARTPKYTALKHEIKRRVDSAYLTSEERIEFEKYYAEAETDSWERALEQWLYDRMSEGVTDLFEKSFSNEMRQNAGVEYEWNGGRCNPYGSDFELIALMQFTGLTDKNGKEIYEGDVVVNNDMNWEVFFDEGAYRLRNLTDNGNWLLMGEPAHSEVVGNIYEHPDLLV